MKKKKEESLSNSLITKDTYTWLSAFMVSSSFILGFFFLSNFPKKIEQYYQNSTKKISKNDTIQVLIENKLKDTTTEKEHKKFLSNKDQKGFGILTNQQEYHSDTSGNILNIQKQSSFSTIEEEKEDSFFTVDFIKIDTNKEIGKNNSKKRTQKKETLKILSNKQQEDANDKMEIPFYYKQKDAFIFSYNKSSKLQIPTKNFEHYDYFKHMFNIIKENWAPPGGRPYPIVSTEYYNTTSVPGRFTYRTFPKQNILVSFVLDHHGNVVKSEVYWSQGYKVLDNSILSAIKRSKNFGIPPKELLINNYLVIPVDFRIQ